MTLKTTNKNPKAALWLQQHIIVKKQPKKKVSIVAFIVKAGECMGRCHPVIDDMIPSFPDFANFYEMCPEFMKARR